jgi:hypothetical protein
MLSEKVAGIFRMPSAESLATFEVSKGSGYRTFGRECKVREIAVS